MSLIRRKWPLLVYALAILHFTLSYCGGARPFLDMNKYMAYSERMPFQGRLLPAILYNGVSAMVDVPAFSFGHLPPRLVIYSILLTAGSLLLTLLAVRDMSRRHMKGTRLTREFVSVALLMSVYFSYLTGYEMKFFLPYDLPSIALWACTLWLAYQRMTWLVVVVFTLSTINRETSIILAPCVIAIYHHRHGAGLRSKLVLVGAMVALWCAVKFLVHEGLQANPREGNGMALNNLSKNISLIMKPVHWPQLASIWGFLGIPFLLFWADIADPTHRAFKWVVASSCAMLCIVGIVVEVRIFGELGLLVVLCLAGRFDAAARALFKAGPNGLASGEFAHWFTPKADVAGRAGRAQVPVTEQ